MQYFTLETLDLPPQTYTSTQKNIIYLLKEYSIITKGCEVIESVNIQILFFTYTNVGSYFVHSSSKCFFLNLTIYSKYSVLSDIFFK